MVLRTLSCALRVGLCCRSHPFQYRPFVFLPAVVMVVAFQLAHFGHFIAIHHASTSLTASKVFDTLTYVSRDDLRAHTLRSCLPDFGLSLHFLSLSTLAF